MQILLLRWQIKLVFSPSNWLYFNVQLKCLVFSKKLMCTINFLRFLKSFQCSLKAVTIIGTKCTFLFLLQEVVTAVRGGVNPSGHLSNQTSLWDLSSSFFFAGTVITTIGKKKRLFCDNKNIYYSVAYSDLKCKHPSCSHTQQSFCVISSSVLYEQICNFGDHSGMKLLPHKIWKSNWSSCFSDCTSLHRGCQKPAKSVV